LQKDARLMLHTSEEPLPALSVAFDALTNAVRAGYGEADFSVMASADRG
jgi:3-hydroxyisobutyrate dehydrogenase